MKINFEDTEEHMTLEFKTDNNQDEDTLQQLYFLIKTTDLDTKEVLDVMTLFMVKKELDGLMSDD